MHYCINCHAKLPDEQLKFCPTCGYDLSTDPEEASNELEHGGITFDPVAQMRMHSPAFAPAGLEKVVFMKQYSRGRLKCLGAAFLCYISAGATALASTTRTIDYIKNHSFFDVTIILTLGILVHMLRSRIASVILLIYALCNMLVMVIFLKLFGGWMGLISGVLAVIGSFQCVKEWETYQARTQTPAQSNVPTL